MIDINAVSYFAAKALKPTLVSRGNSYGVAAIKIYASLLALVKRASVKPSATAVRTSDRCFQVFGTMI